jgi:hypothetical protein
VEDASVRGVQRFPPSCASAPGEVGVFEIAEKAGIEEAYISKHFG